MKQVTFSHAPGAGISPKQLSTQESALQEAIQSLKLGCSTEQSSPYSTPYASLQLSSDAALRAEVTALLSRIGPPPKSTLLLIGIGGSNLGTLAVHEAIHGPHCLRCPNGMQLRSIDTVDSDLTTHIIHRLERALAQDRSVFINVISKSGKTTETIAQFSLFLDLLRTKLPNSYRKQIIVTTDEGSPLGDFAHSQDIATLAIPAKVGGRYSVFSAVGLFPLAFCGIDIDALHAGAHTAVTACQEKGITENPAALRAALLHLWYQKGLHIHDMFIFDTALHNMGLWYRQLVGESLGKQHDLEGKEVRVGITPTVSMGSTDLHSVGQLYLGGPRERFTSFVHTAQSHTKCTVPAIEGLEQLVPHIAGRSMQEIMDAILQGTKRAYEEAKLPFVSITLPEKGAHALGFLLQTLMIETIYLAQLLHVNPFDQPQVERYKKETRAILARNS